MSAKGNFQVKSFAEIMAEKKKKKLAQTPVPVIAQRPSPTIAPAKPLPTVPTYPTSASPAVTKAAQPVKAAPISQPAPAMSSAKIITTSAKTTQPPPVKQLNPKSQPNRPTPAATVPSATPIELQRIVPLARPAVPGVPGQPTKNPAGAEATPKVRVLKKRPLPETTNSDEANPKILRINRTPVASTQPILTVAAQPAPAVALPAGKGKRIAPHTLKTVATQPALPRAYQRITPASLKTVAAKSALAASTVTKPNQPVAKNAAAEPAETTAVAKVGAKQTTARVASANQKRQAAPGIRRLSRPGSIGSAAGDAGAAAAAVVAVSTPTPGSVLSTVFAKMDAEVALFESHVKPLLAKLPKETTAASATADVGAFITETEGYLKSVLTRVSMES
mmetsp:Transcript_42763/g.83840  ORF Transcript_42763/g.83840 Transcript_42763/m.83840 type:complete len:392 (-) Transcript_42763:293-1468(-)